MRTLPGSILTTLGVVTGMGVAVEIALCVALLALVHSRTGAVGDLAYTFTSSTARLSANP